MILRHPPKKIKKHALISLSQREQRYFGGFCDVISRITFQWNKIGELSMPDPSSHLRTSHDLIGALLASAYFCWGASIEPASKRRGSNMLIGTTRHYIPGTQMTLILIGEALLLEGSSPKIEDKQVQTGSRYIILSAESNLQQAFAA